jgi:hypothetical protein
MENMPRPQDASRARRAVRFVVALLALSILLTGDCSTGRAQNSAPAAPSDDWPMESLTLQTGKTLRGIVYSASKEQIEFVEIVRPPGRPMYAVIRSLQPSEVKNVTTLPDALRKRSLQQFFRFRNRARIELGKMDNVELTDDVWEELPCRRYNGQWFTLWSTSDEETTRRCIVRIEQIFRAFRQMFPPREDPEGLKILLLGSLDEYSDFLARHQLQVRNPAFYSAPRNLIVAGSDLRAFGQRLSEARRHNESTRKELEKQNKAFSKRFSKLAEQLRAAGFSADDVAREKNARERLWRDEYDLAMRRIHQARRRNNAVFVERTQRMFQRLNHEAFHAYLENYVFPSEKFAVPRWFNEGLAQIFETAQIDADVLRIDAPHERLLVQLQDDLKSGQGLRLAELLNSNQAEFLRTHDAGGVQRRYLYSWGLAYYLMFHSPPQVEPVNEFVSRKRADEIKSFESFAGATLTDFEQRWRAAMLEMKPQQAK